MSGEIASIDAAHRKIESELRARRRTLSLEAFLLSPGKQAAAIHLDGYDSIKEQSLVRSDPFGLDLSAQERESLNAQIAATQTLADTLERLRRGEIALNEAVRRTLSEMSPDIAALVSEAGSLRERLNSKELERRRSETRELVDKALGSVKVALQSERDDLLAALSAEAGALTDPALTTPLALSKVIEQTVEVAKKFEGARASLSSLAGKAEKRAGEFVQKLVDEAKAGGREALKSAEVLELRENLGDYARDVQQAASLFTKVVLLLSRVQTRGIAEMPPSTSLAFDVPLGNLRDTFINLEATPRRIGDVVALKATLKDGTKVVDTSVANFRVDRYGYYAELSPAVVLARPNKLVGGNDGFRFAPTLSWMHHWAPRPENPSTLAFGFRALDPAIGIHSAFTNFSSGTSSDSVQIGIGGTLSLWKDRLQFGLGYNLMARPPNEGRYYLFIGSDLIGLLQAVGIAKQ